MRNARGPCASSASARVVKLPSDFAIFSPPTWTMPEWIQWRANAWPAPSAWARSFSWCGNTRSSPPPWRSKPLAEQVERHRRALDVPARPARAPRRVPRGLARLRRLPEREVDRAALRFVDLDACAGRLEQLLERAVRRARRTPGTTPRRSTRPARRRRTRGPLSTSSAIKRSISSMYSVACGTWSGRSDAEAVELLPVRRLVTRARARARWSPVRPLAG